MHPTGSDEKIKLIFSRVTLATNFSFFVSCHSPSFFHFKQHALLRQIVESIKLSQFIL